MNTKSLRFLFVTLSCSLAMFVPPPRRPTTSGKRTPYNPKSIFHYGFMNRLVARFEELRKEEYVCPFSPLFFDNGIEPKAPRCNSFVDCLSIPDSLCCYWSSSQTSHCLAGIPKAPKPGNCPPPKFQPIQADSSSCEYDRECGSDDKCCPTLNSIGNQCVNPRRDLGCPSKLYNQTEMEVGVEICTTDSNCSINETCCGQGETKYCDQGVNITPKSGKCPKPTPNDVCDESSPGCEYDSECEGEQRCCTSGCEYKQCVEPFIQENPSEIPPEPSPHNFFMQMMQ